MSSTNCMQHVLFCAANTFNITSDQWIMTDTISKLKVAVEQESITTKSTSIRDALASRKLAKQWQMKATYCNYLFISVLQSSFRCYYIKSFNIIITVLPKVFTMSLPEPSLPKNLQKPSHSACEPSLPKPSQKPSLGLLELILNVVRECNPQSTERNAEDSSWSNVFQLNRQ